MWLGNDIRFAFRQAKKYPSFTLIVLGTLALCIGLNTAVYSVLDAIVLRPVPYPQPGRLGLVETAWRLGGAAGMNDAQSAAQFEAVRDFVPSLDVAAFAGESGANFAAEGRLEYVQQKRVSAGYFRVLGVAPQAGHEFTRFEDAPNGPAVAILSHAFWQRIFRGDPAVVGRAIRLRGELYTVVGIMPRGFRDSVPVDLWTPLRPSRVGEGGDANYQVVARVRPHASRDLAAAQLRALHPELLQGADVPRGAAIEQRIVPFQRGLTGDTRNLVLLTWGAVVVVLLIGCVNVAGLLLARSGARAREIATRMALGGGRGAIVRQLLVESALLAMAGSAGGLAIGSFALDGLKLLAAGRLPSWNPIVLDTRVLVAMLALALLTSVGFGLAPAWQTSRVNLRAVLVEAGRGGGPRRTFSRHALVAAEVALSLVLLVSAGLLVRTLLYLNGMDPGFDTRHVVTAQASLQDARYDTRERVDRLFTASLARIRRIPGVQSAAVALTLPYQRPLNYPFRVLDGAHAQRRMTEAVYVTPGYFETMRMALLRGRSFRDSDTPDSPRVVVVSQSFAARFFPGDYAIGHHLEADGHPREIVGVMGDVQQHSGLSAAGGPYSMDPTLYLPAAQTSDDFLRVIHTWFAPRWVVRTAAAKGLMESRLRSAVAAVDPQLPLTGFQTMDEVRSAGTRGERFNALVFSVFAALALLLAAIGIYGVIAQSIIDRRHELGVRMALGATARQAMLNAIRPGITLAACGMAAGMGLSAVAVRFLAHRLWGVRPMDPVTFAATAAMLLLVAVAASVVPALRVLRLDPARTLRNE